MATVDTLITNARLYADSAVTRAQTFLDTLRELASIEDFEIPDVDLIDPGEYEGFSSRVSTILGNKPIRVSEDSTFSDYRGTIDEINAEPPEMESYEIEIPDEINIPDFEGEKPNIEIPEPPDDTLSDLPGGMDDLEDVGIPAKPTYETPEKPTIEGIGELPLPPTIEFQTATFDDPGVPSIIVPTTIFSWVEADRVSTLKGALDSKLEDDLENGGYGIEDDDEQRLWERAQDRESVNADGVIQESNRKSAVLGWPVPPGASVQAARDAENKARETLSSLQRDIAIKRGDLYVQNRQFIIGKAIEWEAVLINFHSAMMERSLNAAKAVLQLAYDRVDREIALYNSKLDRYKTQAAVYEAEIRANLTKIEVYKAELDGKKLELEVQKIYQELYALEIESVKALISLYATEMDGAKTLAQVNISKIEAYKAEVSAYTEEVKAKAAQFEMFKAQVDGERAKSEIYATEARAYEAEINGKRAIAEVRRLEFQTQAEDARIKLEKFAQELTRWRTRLSVLVDTINNYVNAHNSDINSYVAENTAIAEAAKLGVAVFKAEADTKVSYNNNLIEDARNKLLELSKIAEVRLGASAAGADVYKGMAVGSLDAINTLVQLYSEEEI